MQLLLIYRDTIH